MAMTPSAIRFAPDEKEWITAFAEMNGTTISAQVCQWTLERLEDEMDAHDLKLAIDEGDEACVSWNEAKRELGLT